MVTALEAEDEPPVFSLGILFPLRTSWGRNRLEKLGHHLFLTVPGL